MVVLSKTSLDMSWQIWCKEWSVILDKIYKFIANSKKAFSSHVCTTCSNHFSKQLPFIALVKVLHCQHPTLQLKMFQLQTPYQSKREIYFKVKYDVLLGRCLSLETWPHQIWKTQSVSCPAPSIASAVGSTLSLTKSWNDETNHAEHPWQMVRYGQPFLWNVTAWMSYDSHVHTWLSRLSRAVHDSTRATGSPWIVLCKIRQTFLFWPFFSTALSLT